MKLKVKSCHFINDLDPPEIQMDQQWRLVDKKISVKIDCIVHGNPSAQVNNKFL